MRIVIFLTGLIGILSTIILYKRISLPITPTTSLPTTPVIQREAVFPTSALPTQTAYQGREPAQVSYQNYGWYMHNGRSMQFVKGQWYDAPQEDKPQTQSPAVLYDSTVSNPAYAVPAYTIPTMYIPSASPTMSPFPTPDNSQRFANFQACNDRVYALYKEQIAGCPAVLPQNDPNYIYSTQDNAYCKQGAGQNETSGLQNCQSIYGFY